jgi:hypothetical protein
MSNDYLIAFAEAANPAKPPVVNGGKPETNWDSFLA